MSYRLRISRSRLPSSSSLASRFPQLPPCPHQCCSLSTRPPSSDPDIITEETPFGVSIRPAPKSTLSVTRPRPSLFAPEKLKRPRSVLKTDYNPPPAPATEPSGPPVIWHTMTSYRLMKKHERDNAIYFRVKEDLRWRLIGNRAADITRLEKQFRTKVIIGRKGGLVGNQGVKLREAVPGGGVREKTWVYGSILDGDRDGAFAEMEKLVAEKGALVRVDREEYVERHELRPRNKTSTGDAGTKSSPGKELIENGTAADTVNEEEEKPMDWTLVYERRKKAEVEGKISPDAPKIILDMGSTHVAGSGPKKLKVPSLVDIPDQPTMSGKAPSLGRTSWVQNDELADDEFGRGGGYI